ncbi:MAG: copper resistance protein CopC [Candidatus Limnocylindrales bacterium]
MTSIRRIAPDVAVTLLILLFAAPAALGHAGLEVSDPAEGSTITAPHKGSLTFDEELASDPASSFVVIVNSAEAEVARGEVSETDATLMEVQLPELPPGVYTARWQAITADDAAAERGDFTFTVSAAASGAPTAAQTSGPGDGGEDVGAETPPGKDLTLALVIAALVIGVVLAYVFVRMRRR